MKRVDRRARVRNFVSLLGAFTGQRRRRTSVQSISTTPFSVWEYVNYAFCNCDVEGLMCGHGLVLMQSHPFIVLRTHALIRGFTVQGPIAYVGAGITPGVREPVQCQGLHLVAWTDIFGGTVHGSPTTYNIHPSLIVLKLC